MNSSDIRDALMRSAKKNLSDWIFEYITQQLIDGTLKPGDRLPTEVEYSEQFGVSRNAVREAIKVLTSLGVIEIRRAEGTYVVDHYTKKLLNPVLYSLIISREETRDLLVLNRCLMREIMELGINAMTEEKLSVMQERYEALSRLVQSGSEDVEAMTEQSAEFYRWMAEATENRPIAQIYDMILDILRQTRRQGFVHVVRDNDRTDWMKNYQAIMDYYRGTGERSAEEVCQEIYEVWQMYLT